MEKDKKQLPPNLREATDMERCATCWFHQTFYCERYNILTLPDQVCDEFAPTALITFVEQYRSSDKKKVQTPVRLVQKINKTDLEYLKEYAKRTGNSSSSLQTQFNNILSGVGKEFDWDKSLLKTTELKPPQHMITAAKKGLKLYEEGKNGSGLVPNTVAWARRIVAGSHFSPAKVKKAFAFIERHNEGSRKPGWDKPGEETPGYVAMLLWFNDSNNKGYDWIKSKRDKIEELKL